MNDILERLTAVIESRKLSNGGDPEKSYVSLSLIHILTTHYLEEAQTWCDRIAMMKSGKVVALDTTEALLHRIAES